MDIMDTPEHQRKELDTRRCGHNCAAATIIVGAMFQLIVGGLQRPQGLLPVASHVTAAVWAIHVAVVLDILTTVALLWSKRSALVLVVSLQFMFAIACIVISGFILDDGQLNAMNYGVWALVVVPCTIRVPVIWWIIKRIKEAKSS